MVEFRCPHCQRTVAYHLRNCEFCQFDVGFPNIRRAEAMRPALDANFLHAQSDSDARGLNAQFTSLIAHLDCSPATINISPTLLLQMALGTPYMSYYKALGAHLRDAAKASFHAHRKGVDAKVHTNYEAEIVNATLSPDGAGLTAWGSVALHPSLDAISHRTSVLRENAYDFYTRFNLGERDAVEEPGWRAVWADRGRLGAAHLAPQLTSAQDDAEICALILSSETDRHAARYIELHIYGNVVVATLDRVVLTKPLTTQDDQENWNLAATKLERRGVTVEDRSRP